METPLLKTKLYLPPSRPTSSIAPRSRLNVRLDESLQRTPGVTLISAPAGFGKTTLLSQWIGQSRARTRVAWLSLDPEDNDPVRFLTYLIAALQTIEGNLGAAAMNVINAAQPRPPPAESILTTVINKVTASPQEFVLILDDYHVIESPPIDQALTFLLDHMPPPPRGIHLVVASRTGPSLPSSRWRAGGRITELRADDLRFTQDEVIIFLPICSAAV